MKTIAALATMLCIATPGAAIVREGVTPQQLATAINQAPPLYVPYRTGKMSVVDVRAVRCIAPDEEPTEFECKWQQRVKERWVKRTTWLVIDGDGWHVMDG